MKRPETKETDQLFRNQTARSYEPPRLEFVGTLTELVQSGAGKLSTNAPDGPDVRKPPGQ